MGAIFTLKTQILAVRRCIKRFRRMSRLEGSRVIKRTAKSVLFFNDVFIFKGLKRRSGEKAINAQIMKSGGEPNFVNKVAKMFPLIKESQIGGSLHNLPLDELCQLVINTYPQPWTQISIPKSRETTPSPSPRK